MQGPEGKISQGICRQLGTATLGKDIINAFCRMVDRMAMNRRDAVFVAAGLVGCLLLALALPCKAEKEKTYNITLQKTAGISAQIHEVGNKKVLAEPHRVRQGEHIWQILREKGLLAKGNLAVLLATLKELNNSLGNLDLIHPGQEILVPLKIVPIKGIASRAARPVQVKAKIVELKGMKLEDYTVQPGDSVIKVVLGKYNIPPARLYNEYLQLVRKLNPSIKNLNKIYPGQRIRLPIYSPQVVRKQIKREAPERVSLLKGHKLLSSYLKDLKYLFSDIGEEWKDTGEHFIPLRSGGQIDLKASSFPLITFLTGRHLIVDAQDKLPEKVANLIEQTWPNYKIIHLKKEENLNEILGKIFRVAGYPRVLGKGQTLKLDGPVPVSIAGDWIVVRSEGPLEKGFATVVIGLRTANKGEPITRSVRQWLQSIGVKVVMFPPQAATPSSEPAKIHEISAGKDKQQLVRTILRLTGRRYQEDVEIPVMGNEKSDFNLVIKADLFLKLKGQDAIIDLTGIEQDVVSFLREHQFKVLQLGQKDNLEGVLVDTLSFLGVPFDSGVHTLDTGPSQSPVQIQIKLKGVVFADAQRNAVFATSLELSKDLKEVLAEKGFHILTLTGH